jgi:hypothetical protein
MVSEAGRGRQARAFRAARPAVRVATGAAPPHIETMYHDSDDDRRPREVEILPPEHNRGDDPWRSRAAGPVWMSQRRIYIARPGPFGLILGLLGLATLLAAGFFVFLGLFVLWLPLLGLLAVGAVLSAVLRGPRRF